jgi:hypothetical protein
MASVIIRVELRGNPSRETYQQLHDYMARNRWSMTIASTNGTTQLPHAMYCGTTENSIADLATALKESISTTIWTKVIVLVIAWENWAQSTA